MPRVCAYFNGEQEVASIISLVSPLSIFPSSVLWVESPQTAMMWVFCVLLTSAQTIPLLSLLFRFISFHKFVFAKTAAAFLFWYLQWSFYNFSEFLYHPMHACMHSILSCPVMPSTVCGLWSLIRHYTHVHSTACAFLQVCQMVIEHKTSCVNMNLRNPSISTRLMGSHPAYIRAVTVKRDMILQTSQGPAFNGAIPALESSAVYYSSDLQRMWMV